MRLLLHHVSSVVLACVVMLQRQNAVANVAETVGPFVDFLRWGASCNYDGLNTEFTRRCIFETPIRFKENETGPVFSFSTKFVVSIYLGRPLPREWGYGIPSRNRLEGFTFAMLPRRNVSSGGDGGYLGLLDATSNGDPQSHTFAVEFDFVQSPEFSDPDAGYHIGINVNSMNSTSWVRLEGPNTDTREWPLQVWIDYDASRQILNVSAATLTLGPDDCSLSETQLQYYEFTSNLFNSLSRKVDLSTVLQQHMFVGYTYSISSLAPSNPDRWFGEIVPGPVSLKTSNFTAPALPSAALPCTRYHKPSFVQSHPFEVKLVSILVSLTAAAVTYAVIYACYSRWVERRGWRFKIDPDDLGDAGPHKFTYKELALATKNFDPKLALGRGGFGNVYKGFLPGNRQFVAVKRVAPESNQGEREFLAEVVIIGKIRHRNLVRLQGWCHERGELLLVYDYMPEGSLDKHLFGSPVAAASGTAVVDVGFPWERRFKVVVDVATALTYLHTECEERIIHRDVKAANIMLDAKFNARLGDFGLARCYNHSVLAPESTDVAGTLGYFAPELFHTGKQTEQTDVYSFGAFLLEVACGKKPIYHENGAMLLVDHIWILWGKSCILDAADVRLAGIFNLHEMTLVLCLGLLCSHPNPTMRPSMRQALLILKGDVRLPEVPLSKPQFGYMAPHTREDFSWTSKQSSIYYSAEATTEEGFSENELLQGMSRD